MILLERAVVQMCMRFYRPLCEDAGLVPSNSCCGLRYINGPASIPAISAYLVFLAVVGILVSKLVIDSEGFCV